MGRPKKLKNTNLTMETGVLDYEALYKKLSSESNQLITNLNDQIVRLTKEKDDLIKFYSTNKIDDNQKQVEELIQTVKTLKEKNRILLANYNNLRLKSKK